MHPDTRFMVEDRAALLEFLAAHPFVTLAASVKGAPMIAQAPVVIRRFGDEIALDFHVSRGSVLAPHIVQGFPVIALSTAEDAYISPDWYESADQVPTWNYRSVEAHGFATPLSTEELVDQLDALSVQEEARLAPKPLWTRHKMSPGRFEAMLRGIVGGRLTVERLTGAFKLSQNKNDADRLGAAGGLGDHPLAKLMREA
jgi:transcriptional regulator